MDANGGQEPGRINAHIAHGVGNAKLNKIINRYSTYDRPNAHVRQGFMNAGPGNITTGSITYNNTYYGQPPQEDIHYTASDAANWERELSNCHQALKTSSYERFKDINPKRAQGTCQWVKSHENFKIWHENEGGSLLWVSANPGCGKSVLAKSLVDDELRSSNDRSTCYFFFKDNDEQDNLSTALCAILHQLLTRQPQLRRHAVNLWKRNGNQMQQETSELWQTLLEAAEDEQAEGIVCIFDALDECRTRDQSTLINKLTEFRDTYKETGSRLKFLVTSRPYSDIEHSFAPLVKSVPTIRLQGEHLNDDIHDEINAVVRERVAALAKTLDLSDDVRSRIESKLLHMENRTYLWLSLALDSITTTYQNSLRPSKEDFITLPTSIDAAYEGILGRVSKGQRGTVQTILRIIVGSRRALTVEEMAIALGIATSQEDVENHHLEDVRLDADRVRKNVSNWCGLFVIINDGRVHLIHQTAKEFLLAKDYVTQATSAWKHCLTVKETEALLARICISFLSFKDTRLTIAKVAKATEERYLLPEDPVSTFSLYASDHWPSHLRDGGYDITPGMMQVQVNRLYGSSTNAPHIPWFSIYSRRFSWPRVPPLIAPLLAALLGDEKVVEYNIRHDVYFKPNIDQKGPWGLTALSWAADQGHVGVVKMLIDAGANVNHEHDFGTALLLASSQGHLKVVDMLLDHGARTELRGEAPAGALQRAAHNGHDDVVRSLLSRGANVNAHSHTNWSTPLTGAVHRRHWKVAKTLLEHGADVNAFDNIDGTALQIAVHYNHLETVRMLLDRRADIDALMTGLHPPAVVSAVQGGHLQMLQLLFDNGADINDRLFKHQASDPPLVVALLLGRIKIAQYLLDKGAEVNPQKDRAVSATPLQLASGGGLEAMVKRLLGRDADVEGQGYGQRGTALYEAATHEHEDVVRLLLERGASPHAEGPTHTGKTALYQAAARGNLAIVKLLLDAEDASGKHDPKTRWEALEGARAGRNPAVVRLIEERGGYTKEPDAPQKVPQLELAKSSTVDSLKRVKRILGGDIREALGTSLLKADIVSKSY